MHWIVAWVTESSDRGTHVIEHPKKPTEKELEIFFKENHPEEWDDEYCYIEWTVEKCNFVKLSL